MGEFVGGVGLVCWRGLVLMFVAFLVVIFIIRIVLVKSGVLFVGLLKWFLFMIEFDFGKGFFLFHQIVLLSWWGGSFSFSLNWC